jgi:RNA polymerase sigma-70 factor, ECF subfamily
VNATSEAVANVKLGDVDASVDLEIIFRAQYRRICHVVARVVRDHARAEDLAVEVFLKFSRNRKAQGSRAEGWLYRTAVRMGLDELRRRERRSRYERLLGFGSRVLTPEEIHAATEEQNKVRLVLGMLPRRQSELLLLRSLDLSYAEVAAALDLNPASIGTLTARAQKAFRKESEAIWKRIENRRLSAGLRNGWRALAQTPSGSPT